MKALQKALAILMTLILVLSSMPISSYAAAYDPEKQNEGSATLDLRFWEDRKPDVGFYINAGNRFLLETVTAPVFGTGAGDWSVMDILRGMYTGSDYINKIPVNYFEDYIERVNGYIISKEGNLDRNKSTEWSRVTLAMSSLGKSIKQMGSKGEYILFNSTYINRNGELEYNGASNAITSVAINEDGKFTITEPLAFNYGGFYDYHILMPGTYTRVIEEDGTKTLRDAENNEIVNKEGIIVNPLPTKFVKIESEYDFIEKLSTSYKFSYKQGINGPIWILIALDTGGYELYTEEELTSRGVTVAAGDINTKGKLIDYILDKEITNSTGRVGGWALSGKNADPDITMMAIQGLAPYYLNEEKFNLAGSKRPYAELKAYVERAVVAMAEDQKINGGYVSLGNINSESISQVIVGLTALGIDPMSDSVYLPTIDRTVSFIKDGGEYDGVWTNNMIDALISFWAMGSGSSSEIGGFKHVSTGNDSGGGAGTTVNGMATDQAIYGLIAYDRFLKGENRLYDMTDMIYAEYKRMNAKKYTLNYVSQNENVIDSATYSPYFVTTIPTSSEIKGKVFTGWNTKKDGTGTSYKAGEKLSMPAQDTKLYAQYENITYSISYEMNTAVFNELGAPTLFTIDDEDIQLPTADQINYPGYSFIAWFDNEALEGKAIQTIPQGSYGDKQYFAKWINDDDVAQGVVAMIEALPLKGSIGLEHREPIKDARKAYNNLTENQKRLVSNYDTLVALEVKVNELAMQLEDEQAAGEVVNLIKKLPAVDKIKLTNSVEIQSARSTYDRLSYNQKRLVSNYEALVIGEAKLATLIEQEKDIKAAEAVSNLIQALPSVENVLEIDESKISEIKEAYGTLTAVQKQLVQNYEAVIILDAKIAELKELAIQLDLEKADKVVLAIKELPTVKDLSLDNKPLVESTRASYDNLTAQQKAYVLNYQQLVDIESQIEVLIQKLVVDQKLATDVEIKISNLSKIPELTLDNSQQVNEARKAYDSLTVQQKIYVSNYEKLVEAEQQISLLIQVTIDKKEAATIATKINELPDLQELTLENSQQVSGARKAYDGLTAQQKAYVENYTKLVESESKLVKLQNEENQKELAKLEEQKKLEKLLITGELNKDVVLSPNGTNEFVYGPESGVLTINGNVSIKGNANKNVVLRNIVIKGNLVVDTPNASVVVEKDSKVLGKTTIVNVAAHTFTNKGELNEVVILDEDGTRYVNEKDGIVKTLIINTKGAVTIGGYISIVQVAQSAEITIEEAAEIESLTINAPTKIVLNREATIKTLVAESMVNVTGAGHVESVTGTKVDEVIIKTKESIEPKNEQNLGSNLGNSEIVEIKKTNEVKQEKVGNKLPNTATNQVNILLVGFLVLALGAAIYISRRKVKQI